MRCLPKGLQFFCLVHYCSNSILETLGATSGDILRCKMLDDSEHKPRVSIKINGKVSIIKYDEDFYEMFLVYEGCTDGEGFICDDSKRRAMEIMKDAKYKR